MLPPLLLRSCHIAFFCVGLFTLCCCSKEPGQQTPESPTLLDSKKEIVFFSLKKADGVAFTAGELSVSVKDFAVTIEVPYGTNRNGLVPEISIKGKTISPASGVPQDFTVPVTYTVTAEDGSKAAYTVTVTVAEPGSTIYFGSGNNTFYALDSRTGSLKWKYTSTASFAYSSPTYADGTVYIGGIDNYVYAFDAATGAVKWRLLAANTGIESDAVVVNKTVFVGTNDDELLALDAATGSIKWRFRTGSNISSSPTVADHTVYFGSSDGKLYALDETSGNLKWAFATGGMINQSGAALVDGVLYVGSADGYLYAVNATTGALKWRYSANGISLEQSSPTVANGIVYIGGWHQPTDFTRKGSLLAVNASTGQLVWEGLQNTGISSSPCVANGKLYITADDRAIHALDAATGASLWKKTVLANSASAAVANNTVYVGGGGTGYFYALDAATGAEKWKFGTPGGLMTSSPLILSADNKADYAGDSGLRN